MRNSIQFKSNFLLVSFLCTLAISLSSASKNNKIITNVGTEILGEREIFDELYFSKSSRKMMVTAISVKNDGHQEHAFTSYGTCILLRERDYLRSDLAGIKTDFSDRNMFNGANTIEHIYLSFSNDRFKIKVRFQNWSNDTVELSNVKLAKGRQGYFATGNYYSSSRSYHYTIAFFDESPDTYQNIERQSIISKN